MAIETEQVVDQIEVSEVGIVGYRTVTRVFETYPDPETEGELRRPIGDQLFARTTLSPGQDVPAETPAQVAAICAAAWTPEIIAAYQALST